MRHNDFLSVVRQERFQSDYIPFTHLNSPNQFESRNGQIGMVIRFTGMNFHTALAGDINHWKKLLHDALSHLDARFSVWHTLHRRREVHTLTGNFSNHFAADLDKAYSAQFVGGNFFVNDLYLTIIYKGITTGKVGKGLSFIRRLSHAAIKEARAHVRAAHIKILAKAVEQLCVALSLFKPDILGNNDTALGHSELLAFLSLWINGGSTLHLPNNGNFFPIGKTFSDTQTQHALYPKGNLASYLSGCRLFFGSAIQFLSEGKISSRFGAILSIKQYGNSTTSTMLDNLLSLDAEFISTHSFAIEEQALSLKRIQRQAIKLQNAGDAAFSQQEALSDAQEAIASHETRLGYHHHTIMLFAFSLSELETKIHQAIKCYNDAGFVAVRETLGLIPAFWAQLPTNQRYIARSSLITLENFVDFAPLHNYPTGYCDANHLGSAVTLLETPSKTPVFFNYHVKGEKANPSKGHALIIGGNDSGKTVLMSFLDAQMQRYGGSTFYFDRDQGAKIYVLASEGHYAVLSPNFPESSQFNPFQLSDTPESRSFCHTFLQLLCKNNDDEKLDAVSVENLKHCVDYAFDALSLKHRQLSTVVELLPIDFPHWSNLRRWLKGKNQAADGEYAYLFDNADDALIFHTLMGFDMTHFLDNEPSHVRTPLMFYLLHRIKQNLDGRRVSILLDEGWQYFIDAFWSQELQRLLPTLRKYNAHLVIATQSPSSVLASNIAPMMLDNMPTHIFFANPQAKRRDYVDGFHLTEAEYQFIVNTSPSKRQFIVKQERDSMVCQLNLSTLPQFLSVLSGNKTSVSLVEKLRKEEGDNWLDTFYRMQTAKVS